MCDNSNRDGRRRYRCGQVELQRDDGTPLPDDCGLAREPYRCRYCDGWHIGGKL